MITKSMELQGGRGRLGQPDVQVQGRLTAHGAKIPRGPARPKGSIGDFGTVNQGIFDLMQDFVLFFEEKEGTTAMMRWADRIPQVRVVHHTNDQGWEPLEPFLLGQDLRRAELGELMSAVYAKPRNMGALRPLYAQKVPNRELVELPEDRSIGLKMRWKPPRVFYSGWPVVDLPVNKLFKGMRNQRYMEMMVRILREADVVPMLAVRQNIFKWALSKYHGDGSGKKGHLQFKLASGELDRKDIPRIEVNLNRFGRLVDECRRKHDAKRLFVDRMKQEGLMVQPLLYESFLEDRVAFFSRFLSCLGHDVPRRDLEKTLAGDISLKRVHKGPLSDYVENHEALERRFGSAFESWASA